MNISIILPSRNNLKYLKWSYAAIRKNQGDHTVQICVADDFSDDGTWEWCQEMKITDPNIECIRNNGPVRVGHTILYDKLVNEVAKHEVCMIYHADMYLCPGALDAIESQLYVGMYRFYIGDSDDAVLAKEMWDIQEQFNATKNKDEMRRGIQSLGVPYKYEAQAPITKRIVSLTRIEPPLHPSGPEKIVKDFGTEPEEFDETGLLEYAANTLEVWRRSGLKTTTEGIFAPWAFFKSDFQEIGGHDPLFAPQSKEDSDIFNRFHLNGVEFIQTWEGFVYHMTCRGSRFNPTLTNVGTNSPEWERQNVRSATNFIRKWGHYVVHDLHMKPIVPHKYDIGVALRYATYELLRAIEPWVSAVCISNDELRLQYISEQQPETDYDLTKRVVVGELEVEHDVVIDLDGRAFNQLDMDSLMCISDILADSGVEGSTMNLGNMVFKINRLVPKEMELIHLNK